MDESLKRTYTAVDRKRAKEYRRSDGYVVSGDEAERIAQQAADEARERDRRMKAGTKTETFRLAVPVRRAPIAPPKRKKEEGY